MRVIIVILCVFFLWSNSIADEVKTSAEATAVYSPQTESYSTNFPQAMPLPYLGQTYAPSDRNQEVIKLAWSKVEVETLKPNFSFWDIFSFSKSYRSSVWFRLPENNNPMTILTEPGSGLLLGQIQITDKGEKAPLEVVKESLWYAKQETGATEVLILGRVLPVAKGSSKGIGSSAVTSNITSSDYRQALTAGGSGLYSVSEAYINHGIEVTVLCYGPPVPGVSKRTVVDTEVSAKNGEEKKPHTDDPVRVLRMMLEGGEK